MAEPQDIAFGDFTPDLSSYASPGTANVKNCLPSLNGYRPMPGPNVFSDALDNRCQGAVTVTGNDGAAYSYAGDSTKLYRLVGAVQTDASKSGGYGIADDVQWVKLIIKGIPAVPNREFRWSRNLGQEGRT